jgi:organic hydroperoxide reductase OsmC/OhrA
MPAPFPHHYDVTLRGEGAGGVLTADPRPPILGGAPASFDGSDEWWSPEHLLLSSLSLCLLTTLKAVAAKARLALSACVSRAEGVLDKTPAGLAFTSITLHVDLQVGAADVERARQLLESAKKHCIVSNSLKPPVTLQISVTPA